MIVGVLGGIGSGKSTVVGLFQELGAQVLDADAEAHRAIESVETREALRRWLGESVFRADGTVDRSEVARRVFHDRENLRRLEKIVHPRVIAVIGDRVRAFRKEARSCDVLVLDVPLLAETALADECDSLIFVDASPEIRRERVRDRGWSAEELSRRESFQSPLDEKRALADHVIDNSGSLEETRMQVESCFQQIVAAGSGSRGQDRVDNPSNTKP